MINKDFVTVTFNKADLAFIACELETSAKLYDTWADGADFIGDTEAKKTAIERRDICLSIARSIAQSGREGRG